MLCQLEEVVTLTTTSTLTNNILVFQPVYRSLSVAENITEAMLVPNYMHINIIMYHARFIILKGVMGMKMETGSADEIRGGQSAMGQSGSCNTRYPQSSWVLEELYRSSMQL